MELKTEVTRKDLKFIDKTDLRNVLLERLSELDRVFLVNANCSAIFLSISCIEGIFKHIASIFKVELNQSSNYPRNSSGKKKSFDKLTITELYTLLKEQNLLPGPQLDNIYTLFKDYRNFIHPQKQMKMDWPIDLGQSQMAIGLLNATITSLSKKIFIEKNIFTVIEGNPDYSENILYLKLHRTPLNSCLVLEQPVSDKITISFDLELPKKSILNFIFNYSDENSFKMIRLDARETPEFHNCLLHCTQKYFWRKIFVAQPQKPSSDTLLRVEVSIDFGNQIFTFNVNSKQYIFKEPTSGAERDIFKEIVPNKKIGFFNEVGPIKLQNVKLMR